MADPDVGAAALGPPVGNMDVRIGPIDHEEGVLDLRAANGSELIGAFGEDPGQPVGVRRMRRPVARLDPTPRTARTEAWRSTPHQTDETTGTRGRPSILFISKSAPGDHAEMADPIFPAFAKPVARIVPESRPDLGTVLRHRLVARPTTLVGYSDGRDGRCSIFLSFLRDRRLSARFPYRARLSSGSVRRTSNKILLGERGLANPRLAMGWVTEPRL